MRWPWRKDRVGDVVDPAGTPHPVPAPPMGWAFLPPLQRTLGPLEPVTEPQRFPQQLPAWRNPSHTAPGLTHVVSPEAPSGIVDGDGRGGATGEPPHLAPAVELTLLPPPPPTAQRATAPRTGRAATPLTTVAVVPGLPAVQRRAVPEPSAAATGPPGDEPASTATGDAPTPPDTAVPATPTATPTTPSTAQRSAATATATPAVRSALPLPPKPEPATKPSPEAPAVEHPQQPDPPTRPPEPPPPAEPDAPPAQRAVTPPPDTASATVAEHVATTPSGTPATRARLTLGPPLDSVPPTAVDARPAGRVAPESPAAGHVVPAELATTDLVLQPARRLPDAPSEDAEPPLAPGPDPASPPAAPETAVADPPAPSVDISPDLPGPVVARALTPRQAARLPTDVVRRPPGPAPVTPLPVAPRATIADVAVPAAGSTPPSAADASATDLAGPPVSSESSPFAPSTLIDVPVVSRATEPTAPADVAVVGRAADPEVPDLSRPPAPPLPPGPPADPTATPTPRATVPRSTPAARPTVMRVLDPRPPRAASGAGSRPAVVQRLATGTPPVVAGSATSTPDTRTPTPGAATAPRTGPAAVAVPEPPTDSTPAVQLALVPPPAPALVPAAAAATPPAAVTPAGPQAPAAVVGLDLVGPTVQRQEPGGGAVTGDAAPPSSTTGPGPDPGAAPAHPGAEAPGAAPRTPEQVEELAGKLWPAVLRRIRHELVLDRERIGLRTDTW